MTYITVVHDYDTNKFPKIKEELKNKGFEVLNNDILDIDANRQIHVQAYYQLKQKSNNPYVYFLYSKMVSNKIKEIKNSDIILFFNEIPSNMSQLMFFYITIAWFLQKKVFLWKPLDKKLPFYNEIFSIIDIPVIYESIDKLPINYSEPNNIILKYFEEDKIYQETPLNFESHSISPKVKKEIKKITKKIIYSN